MKWIKRLFAPRIETLAIYCQPMTPEQRAYFDEAFRQMDRAFEEVRKITGTKP